MTHLQSSLISFPSWSTSLIIGSKVNPPPKAHLNQAGYLTEYDIIFQSFFLKVDMRLTGNMEMRESERDYVITVSQKEIKGRLWLHVS